jgi:hypothetical protein
VQARPDAEQLTAIVKRVDAGEVRVDVSAGYPLSQTAAAGGGRGGADQPGRRLFVRCYVAVTISGSPADTRLQCFSYRRPGRRFEAPEAAG